MRAIASQGGGSTLWFVDDHCAQAGAGTPVCDANKNHQLGYFEYVAGSWAPRSTLPLPGTVQQNTATIAAAGGTVLHSYGVDDVSHLLRECTYSIAKGPQGCIALPFTLTANSNYVGAAVSPAGHRVVWWTNVVDGGGGGFHYIVDYGGGWNGPRSGSAAGYNDASYINIAFGGPTPNTFTMHVQFVSGFAPNWGFVGGVGSGDLSTTAPVTWSLPLAPASGDEVLSTNDIWIDPNTKDTHLMARTKSGAAVYYFRPDGGSWSPASFTLPATFRARFIVSGGRLILVYGPNAGGLAYRIAKSSDRIPKTPIDWQNVGEQKLSLPAGFGSIVAIYPESPAYQATPAQGIHAVVVGSTKESETLHVAIEPG